MSETEKKALELFNSGYNCAQAVVGAFANIHQFDEELAMGLSCGLGAGMGRMQETCGAVSGAFLVIGLYSYKQFSHPAERKEHAYPLIREFNRRFTELHKTTNCRKLLKCDLMTEDGRQYAKKHNLHETVCGILILDTIKIINDMIKR